MGFDYFNSYYKMGLFTKDDLDLFVSVNYLSQDDESKILA